MEWLSEQTAKVFKVQNWRTLVSIPKTADIVQKTASRIDLKITLGLFFAFLPFLWNVFHRVGANILLCKWSLPSQQILGHCKWVKPKSYDTRIIVTGRPG